MTERVELPVCDQSDSDPKCNGYEYVEIPLWAVRQAVDVIEQASREAGRTERATREEEEREEAEDNGQFGVGA